MDMLLNVNAAPSKTIRNPVVRFQCLSIRGPKRKDHQIILLFIRSRVICQVSALSKCKTGTSSPHAGKGHKRFQECPSELSCSLPARKTCGSVSGGDPSSCARPTTC